MIDEERDRDRDLTPVIRRAALEDEQIGQPRGRLEAHHVVTHIEVDVREFRDRDVVGIRSGLQALLGAIS